MSEPIEVVPEKIEYLLQDSGEELEDWMDEEVGEYGLKEVNIDRATMKAIARRSTQIKVLRFLLKHSSRDFSRKEIKNAIEMPESTVHRALVRLVDAKILERIVPSAIDKRFKCYRIANLKIVRSIIKLHDRIVSFRLAKLLPYGFISLENLRKNKKFLALCKKFRLEFADAIECLKLNTRKVEFVLSNGYKRKGQLVGFRRREQ